MNWVKSRAKHNDIKKKQRDFFACQRLAALQAPADVKQSSSRRRTGGVSSDIVNLRLARRHRLGLLSFFLTSPHHHLIVGFILIADVNDFTCYTVDDLQISVKLL